MTYVNEIVVSSAEKAAGSLSPEHLREATRAIREDGFVILGDVIDPEHVRVLRDRMVSDLQKLVARKDAPYNWNNGNIQQDPPPFPPYLFRDVVANDLVIQVTQAILGKGVKNVFYSGNTALKSENRQPVHADSGHLWPDLSVAHPAYSLVVNVPVVDMDQRNGSTEIWPGTHLDTTIVMQDGEIKLPTEKVEHQRAVAPPLQPTVRAGRVVFSDIRLWHAGMPNRTDDPRPMIAMIHSVSWMPSGPLKFPKGTESIFEHPVLHTHAEFVDEELDHISTPHGFEFEERPV